MTSKEKKRIIFVDDEPAIIRSYERFFFDMDEEWDMDFVLSAADALSLMEKAPYDVLVTDIRMPGMDGFQLLEEVKQKYTATVRIVVSGQFDEKLLLNSVNLVNQYLFKPCDPEEVLKLIQKAISVDDTLNDERLHEIVSGMDSVPTLPSIYNEITALLRNQNSSLKAIGTVISKDIALTAKVLHLVNSSFFGLRRKITAPEEAVVYIGTETIKAMVLSVQVFSLVQEKNLPAGYLDSLWDHSFITANFARTIAMCENQEKVMIDNSFTAGILHDIGRLILLTNLPDEYGDYLEKSRSEKDSLQLERSFFRTDHCEIGAYLMHNWGLPNVVIEPVLYHDNPSGYSMDEFSPVFFVTCANLLFYKIFKSKSSFHAKEWNENFITNNSWKARLSIWEESCRASLSAEE